MTIKEILENIKKLTSRVLHLEEKNILTARLNSHYTIKNTDETEDIKDFAEFSKMGNKLSIENGVIKIGKGVSKVKVSYTAMSRNNSSVADGRAFTYLTSNNYQISQEPHYYFKTGQQISTSLPSILINVNEGDTFFLRTYGPKGIQIFGESFLWTTITVEVVE